MAKMLTAKQKRFVDEYLIDSNATQAAKRAGYSEKTAYAIGAENLTKPEIAAAIAAALEALHSAAVADAAEVLEYLTAVMRGEHTEKVPILCGEGYQCLTDKDVGAKDRLKAAELLGKKYSMFTDKLGFEGAIPVIISGDEDLED
ncbi:MAG: terminase small subunit [Acinetobacter sp.]